MAVVQFCLLYTKKGPLIWQLYLPDGVDGVSVVDGGRVVTEIQNKRKQIEPTLEKLIIELQLLIIAWIEFKHCPVSIVTQAFLVF